MSIQADYWVGRGWDVTILTLDDGARAPFYRLDRRVRHLPLGLAFSSHGPGEAVANNLLRLQVLRRELRRIAPDAVVSFLPAMNVLAIMAARSLRVPVVVSERVDPFLYRIGATWDTLRMATYGLANAIVVQTHGALEFYPWPIRRRVTVIPNPVPLPVVEEQAEALFPRRPVVVGLGRLHREKGFDLLLEAMARLASVHPEWSLAVLGEGPARQELEALRDRLGLGDRVWLPGAVTDPARYLKQADLFVLPSRTEGFPNALCEAMACGLPVIAADCRSGPSEIVRPGLDGLLVPVEDVSALATAIDRLIRDAPLRKALASRAPEVLERFGMERVMGAWEDLLEQVVVESRKRVMGRAGVLDGVRGRRDAR